MCAIQSVLKCCIKHKGHIKTYCLNTVKTKSHYIEILKLLIFTCKGCFLRCGHIYKSINFVGVICAYMLSVESLDLNRYIYIN